MSNLSSLIANLSEEKINVLLPNETALIKGGTYGYGYGRGKSGKKKSGKKSGRGGYGYGGGKSGKKSGKKGGYGYGGGYGYNCH
jgi:hypothetical protein